MIKNAAVAGANDTQSNGSGESGGSGQKKQDASERESFDWLLYKPKTSDASNGSSGSGEFDGDPDLDFCTESCGGYFQCHLDTTAVRVFKVDRTALQKNLCTLIAEAFVEEGYEGLRCTEGNVLAFSDQETCKNVLSDTLNPNSTANKDKLYLPLPSDQGGLGCSKEGFLAQLDVTSNCKPMAATLNLLDAPTRVREASRF